MGGLGGKRGGGGGLRAASAAPVPAAPLPRRGETGGLAYRVAHVQAADITGIARVKIR